MIHQSISSPLTLTIDTIRLVTSINIIFDVLRDPTAALFDQGNASQRYHSNAIMHLPLSISMKLLIPNT
jgi:hypothetical protein